jgi:hypothetical protein
VNLWATVETAYQRRAVEQHTEQLDAARRALDAQMRNAALALSDR